MKAFGPVTNCDPEFCAQRKLLSFTLRASASQFAPLRHRTKAVKANAGGVSQV
jgi:hypothetical protein